MSKNSVTVIVIIAAVLTLASACNSSDVDSAKFLGKAEQDGMAEIQVCKLALQQSSSDDVKKFAQRMIDDHAQMDQEITRIAGQKKVQLPTDITEKQKSTYADMAKLSGADFDKQFMDHNVEDHQTDIKDFKEQSEKGSDPDVKAFAAKTLQTLNTHLQLSKDVDDKVKH